MIRRNTSLAASILVFAACSSSGASPGGSSTSGTCCAFGGDAGPPSCVCGADSTAASPVTSNATVTYSAATCTVTFTQAKGFDGGGSVTATVTEHGDHVTSAGDCLGPTGVASSMNIQCCIFESGPSPGCLCSADATITIGASTLAFDAENCKLSENTNTPSGVQTTQTTGRRAASGAECAAGVSFSM